VLDGDPTLSPPQKGGTQRGKAAPTFRSMSIVAKRLDGPGWIKMPLGMVWR